MADNKISDLPTTSALTLDDLLEAEQPAQAAGTRSRRATISQLLALLFDNDAALAGDSADKAATQHAVKTFVEGAISDALASLAPPASAVAMQFLADTGSTSDADPGAGKLRWNHATQGSATMLFLDDSSDDGVSLTGLWPALNAGGTIFLQHATDQDTWQIWEVTAITDASGYAKLAVTNLVNGGTFANGDPILVTIDRAQAGSSGASTTQADECISGLIVTPSNGDYRIVVKAPHGGTITEVTTISASGTCTLTVKINTTALSGTANSVSSTEQSQTHSSANIFSAGDDIVLTVSSNSSCSKMTFTIKYTRTLA